MSRITELKKEVKELAASINELQEEYEKKFIELHEQEEIENEKDLEFTFPFVINEEYFELQPEGIIKIGHWNNVLAQQAAYVQCNIFKQKEKAYLEKRKRELLMRLKQFRDKRNDDWKPDFNNFGEDKYYILFNHRKELNAEWTGCSNQFNQFGYFKNQTDCERAIELFGDEIKRLFVEAEYE